MSSLETLISHFPKCFSREAPQPLKINIRQDLAKAGIMPRLELAKALGDYCRSPAYLTALREGAKRIDLFGRECGTVDERQERMAAEELKHAGAETTQTK